MKQWRSTAVLPDKRDDTRFKSLHGLSCKHEAWEGRLFLLSKPPEWELGLFKMVTALLRKERGINYSNSRVA